MAGTADRRYSLIVERSTSGRRSPALHDIPRARALLLLAAIVALAAILRVVNLSSNPNGLFCDEASSGYDAYSLLHTGRDSYGGFLPLYAHSFGVYEDTLMRYLTVPAVAVFGLTEFATRLPAAIVGTLT